jgi:hypothetical protein
MVELSMQHSYLTSSDTLNSIPSPASHTPRYCRWSRTKVEANGCSGTQYVLAYLLYSLVSIAARIVFYEVTGTVGAFSCSVLIKRLGNNYAFLATPACFFAAGVAWWFVDSEFSESHTTQHTAESDQPNLKESMA